MSWKEPFRRVYRFLTMAADDKRNSLRASVTADAPTSPPLVFTNWTINVIPPSPPGTWWTCGVCGRRSSWTPGVLRGWGELHDFYKPSFWYYFDGVLHCKDCGWRHTDRFKNTGDAPPGGWYPPCDGKPVIEYSKGDLRGRCYVIVEEDQGNDRGEG